MQRKFATWMEKEPTLKRKMTWDVLLQSQSTIAVFFIQDGKTALFYAAQFPVCEDDEVKDVLRYLVIEKGSDINSVDDVAILR